MRPTYYSYCFFLEHMNRSKSILVTSCPYRRTVNAGMVKGEQYKFFASFCRLLCLICCSAAESVQANESKTCCFFRCANQSARSLLTTSIFLYAPKEWRAD